MSQAEIVDDARRAARRATCAGRTARPSGWSTTPGPRPTPWWRPSPRCSSTTTPSTPRRSRASAASRATSCASPPTCSTATTDVAGFMTSGGTESILCAVKAARERGREERGITEPEMVVPASAHAAFHKAAHYFGIRLHKVPVRDDWRADVDAMAQRRRAEHGAGGGQRAAVPAGRGRPDPRPRGRGRRGGRQLPHRRVHGRLLAPVRRGARPRRAAVGLPGGRRHHDQRRPAQARLRAEGRVGGAPPHQGAAPLPDLRVRRLARRLLRELRHAGHAVRAADGHGLGHAPPPRPRGLPAAHRAHHRHPRPHGRRHPGHRRARGARRAGSTVRRDGHRAGLRGCPRRVRGGRRAPREGLVPRSPEAARLAALHRQRRERRGASSSTSPTWPGASPRSAAPASAIAPPATRPWNDAGPFVRRHTGRRGPHRPSGPTHTGAAVPGDRRTDRYPGAPQGRAPPRDRRVQGAGRHQRRAPAVRRGGGTRSGRAQLGQPRVGSGRRGRCRGGSRARS